MTFTEVLRSARLRIWKMFFAKSFNVFFIKTMRVELFGMLQNQSRLKRNKKLTNLRVSLACGQLFQKEMLAGGRPCSLQGSLVGAISLSFILISWISRYLIDFYWDFTGLIAISIIFIAMSLFVKAYFPQGATGNRHHKNAFTEVLRNACLRNSQGLV